VKYHWKGRTRDGREVEGDMDVRLRDEVVARLQKLGITTSSVEERNSGEPEDPDVLDRSRRS